MEPGRAGRRVEHQPVHGAEMGGRRKAPERAIVEAAEFAGSQGLGGGALSIRILQ